MKYMLWSLENKFYNLDGYRLRLALKSEKGLKFLGKVITNGRVRIDESEIKREELYRDDIVIGWTRE